MYDIKFIDGEKIELISDNTIIYTEDDERICSSVVTNKRYLILDYPSGVHNSMEDLRISGKMTYVKMKEVIFSTDIKDIDKIIKKDKASKIILKNGEYILISDDEILSYLENKL